MTDAWVLCFETWIWLILVQQIDAEVRRLTNGFGVHACIVSAGSEAAYSQGLKLVRNLGTLVCVGIPRLDFDLPISPFMMIVRGIVLSCQSP